MDEQFAENVTAIDTNLTRMADENKRMRRLLSQVALFVACQPENPYRTRWLKEVEEVCNPSAPEVSK